MNNKAEKFSRFLTAHQLQDSFLVSTEEHGAVVFASSLTVPANIRLKLTVLLAEDPRVMIRVWPATAVTAAARKKMLIRVNRLNQLYRLFKFFIDPGDKVIMDWLNFASDTAFDPNLIHFTLGVINREIAYIYQELHKS